MTISIERLWLAVGFAGQALFTARFVVQWLASERKRDSVVPVAFWWFSLMGGLTLLSYAVWKRDPVFIVGQGMGLVVYVRNLMLLKKATRRSARRLSKRKTPAKAHHHTKQTRIHAHSAQPSAPPPQPVA